MAHHPSRLLGNNVIAQGESTAKPLLQPEQVIVAYPAPPEATLSLPESSQQAHTTRGLDLNLNQVIQKAGEDSPSEIIANPDPTKVIGGNVSVREDSKATPNIATVDRCVQESPVYSLAVATKLAEADAQQTTPQSAIGQYPVHDTGNFSQLKRKAQFGQELPNTKREAVAVGAGRPYRNQQHQDSMFRNPTPSWGSGTNRSSRLEILSIAKLVETSTTSQNTEAGELRVKTQRGLHTAGLHSNSRNATTLCLGDSGSTQMVDCLHNHFLPVIHSRTSTSSTITPKDSNPNTTSSSIKFLLNSNNPSPIPLGRTPSSIETNPCIPSKRTVFGAVGNEENPAKLSHELVPHDAGSSSSTKQVFLSRERKEGTPATQPLSDGQGSVRAPQILESTDAFLTIESEPRESKPLTPLKQNFPTSYGRSNPEIYSKAQVEELASHSPAIQRGLNHIASGENTQPTKEENKHIISFLIDNSSSNISSNAQRVDSSATELSSGNQDFQHFVNSPTRNQVETIHNHRCKFFPSCFFLNFSFEG
jgi:hypothetical protein